MLDMVLEPWPGLVGKRFAQSDAGWRLEGVPLQPATAWHLRRYLREKVNVLHTRVRGYRIHCNRPRLDESGVTNAGKGHRESRLAMPIAADETCPGGEAVSPVSESFRRVGPGLEEFEGQSDRVVDGGIGVAVSGDERLSAHYRDRVGDSLRAANSRTSGLLRSGLIVARACRQPDGEDKSLHR